MNSDSIFWRLWPAAMVTSASEQNGHSDLGPNDCTEHMKFNVSYCE